MILKLNKSTYILRNLLKTKPSMIKSVVSSPQKCNFKLEKTLHLNELKAT
jgi:hypothetical protein